MHSVGSELVTWLFIALAGLAFGGLALVRALRGREGDAFMRRAAKRSSEAPAPAPARVERITRRSAAPEIPKFPEPEPVVKPVMAGPRRPAVLVFGAPGSPAVLMQRTEAMEDADAVEAPLSAEVLRAPALELLACRASALMKEPDDDLALDRFTVTVALPAQGVPSSGAPLELRALNDNGLPVGEAVVEAPDACRFFAELAEVLQRIPQGGAGLTRAADAAFIRARTILQEAAQPAEGEASEVQAEDRFSADLKRLFVRLEALRAGAAPEEESLSALEAQLNETSAAIDRVLGLLGNAEGGLMGSPAETAAALENARRLTALREASERLGWVLAGERILATTDYAAGLAAAARLRTQAAAFPDGAAAADAVAAAVGKFERSLEDPLAPPITPEEREGLPSVRAAAEVFREEACSRRRELAADAASLTAAMDRRLLAAGRHPRWVLRVTADGRPAGVAAG